MSDVTADPPADTTPPAPPEPKRRWIVVCEVEGKNPGMVAKAKQALTGKNEGGVIVRLGDSDGRFEEIARVGWMRRNTANPDENFKNACKDVTDIAWGVADVLNDNERRIAELLAQARTKTNGEALI